MFCLNHEKFSYRPDLYIREQLVAHSALFRTWNSNKLYTDARINLIIIKLKYYKEDVVMKMMSSATILNANSSKERKDSCV